MYDIIGLNYNKKLENYKLCDILKIRTKKAKGEKE